MSLPEELERVKREAEAAAQRAMEAAKPALDRAREQARRIRESMGLPAKEDATPETLAFRVGNLRKDPGYGTILVDVDRSDEKHTPYPTVECTIWLGNDDRLRPGIASYCSSTHPLSLEDLTTLFARVREFAREHEASVRELLK